MFTETDVQTTATIIKKRELEKVYVVGITGSGKTTFAKELARILRFKNIDIDKWFKKFHRKHQRPTSDLKELLGYIMETEKPPYIINHSDLLINDLVQEAEIIVYLNPRKEELERNWQLRKQVGAEGMWKAVTDGDFSKIVSHNLVNLDRLGRRKSYENKKSGTTVYVL